MIIVEHLLWSQIERLCHSSLSESASDQQGKRHPQQEMEGKLEAASLLVKVEKHFSPRDLNYPYYSTLMLLIYFKSDRPNLPQGCIC